MAKNRNSEEIKLLEAGFGVLSGFNHLLVTLAVQMGLPSGTLYRLGTPEGHETLLAATKAFLAEISNVWRIVTSPGLTRDELIASVKAKGRETTSWAKDLMSKPQFITTSGVTYKLVIIRGDEFATDAERTFANIQAEGIDRRHYGQPPAEVGLLLAQYTHAELGHRYVVVMHEPISDSGGYLGVLVLRRDDGGSEYLRTWSAGPTYQFYRDCVFVFLAPQGVVET